MIDAKEVSAAHRARYFWGNLPGMNRLVRAPCPGGRGWVSAGRMMAQGVASLPCRPAFCSAKFCLSFSLRKKGSQGVENNLAKNRKTSGLR